MTQKEHIEHLYTALECLRMASAQLTDPIYMRDMAIKQQIEQSITDIKEDIHASEEACKPKTRSFSTTYYPVQAASASSVTPKPQSASLEANPQIQIEEGEIHVYV